MATQIFLFRMEFFLTVECWRVLFPPRGMSCGSISDMMTQWFPQFDLRGAEGFISVGWEDGLRTSANPPK
jgi:hypothetical protein